MAKDNGQFQAPSSESLEVGYETSTVSVKALAWFVIGLVIVAAIVHAGMWFLLMGYVNYDQKKDQPFSALTDQQFIDKHNRKQGTALKVSELPPPPAPRIQDHDPAADLADMYKGEDDMFRRMGWEIDPRSHQQLKIPNDVVSAVIQEEAAKQKQETQSK